MVTQHSISPFQMVSSSFARLSYHEIEAVTNQRRESMQLNCSQAPTPRGPTRMHEIYVLW
jgi:hypothetical protein